MARLLGRERLGGAGEEDHEPPAALPRPPALALVPGPVRLGRVGPDLEEAPPRPAPRDVQAVLHVTAHPAQRRAERAAPVRLQRVRADRLQEARRPCQDRLDRGQLGVHGRVPEGDIWSGVPSPYFITRRVSRTGLSGLRPGWHPQAWRGSDTWNKKADWRHLPATLLTWGHRGHSRNQIVDHRSE